ncbi:MAG: acetate/propionate family kinase [Atribacterota bacterium]|nr:acetate/propionate family kinase [Atribacterota bacterium]
MNYILVINIGSTSLKYQLYNMDNESVLIKGLIERIGSQDSIMEYKIVKELLKKTINTSLGYTSAIEAMLDTIIRNKNNRIGVIERLSEIRAIGFKAVHCGKIFQSSLIDDSIISMMEEYSSVVPAHNPPYINAIKQFKKILPNMPLVGVFETNFHKDIPDYAHIYSIPYKWYEKYNIRRYGFHGASHRYISEAVCKIFHSGNDLKIISCHLGGSSSISAIKNGKSIENSMGFSAQAGVPMSNRCGDLDPFSIPFIMEKEKLKFEEVMEILVKKSGLLGISGISGDMRDLEENYNSNHRASLALNTFIYQTKKYIGSYIAVLGGLDVLTFEGGIGENSPLVREKICHGMEYLGIHLDHKKNQSKEKEIIISKNEAKVKIIVVPTNEELIVARETLNAIKSI